MAKCLEGCTCGRHSPGPRPQWVRELISSAKMGHEVSEETRKKIGDAARGRVHSEQTRQKRAESRTEHGHHGKAGRSGTYRSWDGMKQRCLNPKATGYKRYGGAGVTVSARWLDFQNFLDDMGVRPDGTTLDRIDPSKGYEPGNCRWADRSTQNRNRPNFNPNKRGGS